ncbi:MAG: hypothetical protein AABN33_00415 [Acidobacteriota bacterium]
MSKFDGVRRAVFLADSPRMREALRPARDRRLITLVRDKHIDVLELSDTGIEGRHSRICKSGALFVNAAFSPDQGCLAIVYLTGARANATVTLSLWTMATGKDPCTGGPGESWTEGKILASTRIDQTSPDTAYLANLSFSTDGKSLASNVGAVARLWDLASGREYRLSPPTESQEALPEEVRLSPDGKYLAVYFSADRYRAVHLWEWQSGGDRRHLCDVYSDMKFSPDSTLFGFTLKADLGEVTEHTAVEVIAVNDLSHRQTIHPPKEYRGVSAIGFLDSERLAIGGHKRIGFFSLKTGQPLGEGSHPGPFMAPSQLAGEVTDIEFSLDGLMLTSGESGAANLWRVSAR